MGNFKCENFEKKNLPPISLSNNSLWQIFKVSVSGTSLRIKFLNRYGTSLLKIQKAIISDSKSQGTSQIDINTIKPITFSGKEKINIEEEEEIYSDIIEYNLKALSELYLFILE